jgi:hypothetical protein
MVAASATAILNDIQLSNASVARRAVKSDQNRQKRLFPRKFLTARVNQTLSTPVLGLVLRQQERKCSKQSK